MSTSEPWTIKRLLEWTTDYLGTNGSDSARLDAEVLLAEARGCQRIELYTSYDEIPPEPELTQFRDWIKQRAQGKPVAYLVGHREFYSLSFQVNEQVLIPRPETELLVTLAIDELLAQGPSPRVCDIGTGSGCVAIAIARNHSGAEILAADISESALEIATINADRLGVTDRIQLRHSNLLENLKDEPPFDLIVSNPPYIGQNESDPLSVDVRAYEPELALYGGENGSEIIAELIDQSAHHLRAGGKLMFETSPHLIDVCHDLASATNAFENIEIHRDLSKHPRVISAVKT